MSKPAVLVTGANGFIGTHLCAHLNGLGWKVIAACRDTSLVPPSCAVLTLADINSAVDLEPALANVSAVVHLAGVAHRAVSDSEEYYRVNADGTAALAGAAARAGVQLFIYLSSVKVNGEETAAGADGHFGRFSESSIPVPMDDYGYSKLLGEEALKKICGSSGGMHYVILRIPLVYGRGVKGNLRSLIRLVSRRMPLPLASVKNRRSLLYVGNLCSAIQAVLESPAGRDRVYLLKDNEDLSTPELVRALAAGLGRRPLLWPLPVWLLRGAGAMCGCKAAVERLTGSLCINDSLFRRTFSWHAPIKTVTALRLSAKERRR